MRLPLVLGSSAASRRAVLDALGASFSTLSPDIDERAVAGRSDADARATALAVAHAKASVLEPLARALHPGGCLLVAADQVVVGPDARAREKPEDEAQARAFALSYSGAIAQTVSAVVVAAVLPNASSGARAAGVEVSTVRFRAFGARDVDEIVAPGAAVPLMALLPLVESGADSARFVYGSKAGHGRSSVGVTGAGADAATGAAPSVYSCAGALCVEHEAYARSIARIEGTLDGLHGLPLHLVRVLAQQVVRESGGGLELELLELLDGPVTT
jgi:predicted house-cleaning NTP pyrophosphatase (Maf/HAM1 superfamily)